MTTTRRWMLPLVAALLLALAGPISPAAGVSTSADTERVQRRLNALGCSAGPADGRLGAWTRSAVTRFQSRHGLAQTGTLTTTTRQRLFAGTAHRCDVRPVPAQSGSGRRIVISQSQNWVWLVGADNRALAQGGIVDNPDALRKGTFATASYCGRAARIRMNSSGSLWLDHFIRFAPCGFGFHRIPRSKSSGRQIHPDWYLGTNLSRSHGCVRVSATTARRIWDFTASGRTTVRVL